VPGGHATFAQNALKPVFFHALLPAMISEAMISESVEGRYAAGRRI